MKSASQITKTPVARNVLILVLICVAYSLALKLFNVIGEASFVTLTCISVFVGVLVYFKESIQDFDLGLSGIKIKLKAIDVMVAKQTEPLPQCGNMPEKSYGTDSETNQVIKSLGSEKYTWRYLGGIAQETNLPREVITKSLDWLVANKLAAEEQGNKGKIWGLSSEGRLLLSAIVSTESFNSSKV